LPKVTTYCQAELAVLTVQFHAELAELTIQLHTEPAVLTIQLQPFCKVVHTVCTNCKAALLIDDQADDV